MDDIDLDLIADEPWVVAWNRWLSAPPEGKKDRAMEVLQAYGSVSLCYVIRQRFPHHADYFESCLDVEKFNRHSRMQLVLKKEKGWHYFDGRISRRVFRRDFPESLRQAGKQPWGG